MTDINNTNMDTNKKTTIVCKPESKQPWFPSKKTKQACISNKIKIQAKTDKRIDNKT